MHLPSFRQPMHVRVPRPPWAMRKQEASSEPPESVGERAAVVTTTVRRLEPRPYDEQP